jgi:hypothetical protein
MSAAQMHYELAAKAGRYGPEPEAALACHDEHCGVFNDVEECDCGRLYCNDHGLCCADCGDPFCLKCLVAGVGDQKWRCIACDAEHERERIRVEDETRDKHMEEVPF